MTRYFIKRKQRQFINIQKMLNLINNKKMQIKTTMHHFIPIPLANIKSDNNKCWRGCRSTVTLTHCWSKYTNRQNCWPKYKLIPPLQKAIWHYFVKLIIHTPWSSNPISSKQLTIVVWQYFFIFSFAFAAEQINMVVFQHPPPFFFFARQPLKVLFKITYLLPIKMTFKKYHYKIK